jgi:hypothetical protein
MKGIHLEVILLSDQYGHWTYGRCASGTAFDENIWWPRGKSAPGDPTAWSDLSGVHPNLIILGRPLRVSGQSRSSDTVVTVPSA